MSEQEQDHLDLVSKGTEKPDTLLNSFSRLQGDRKAERFLLVIILALQCYMLGKLMQLEKRPYLETTQPQQAQLSIRNGSPTLSPLPTHPRQGIHSSHPMPRNAAILTDIHQLMDLASGDNSWDQLPTTPQMNLHVSNGYYNLALCMPPNTSSNISISVEGRVLLISTEKDSLEHGSFNAQVRLPGPVGDTSLLKSKLSDGVLHIEVPRGEEN